MDIGIIGGGAIGLLFACHLSAQANITVYTNRKEQADTLNAMGISMIHKGKESHYKINAASDHHYKEQVIIVAVKQFQLEQVIKGLSAEKGKQILFLQNGMGHLKMLSALKGNDVYVGTVEHGAKKESDFIVKHNGSGPTRIALFLGQQTGESHIRLHQSEAFPIIMEDDWRPLLERKLLINACINPLTALLGVKNGILLENPHYFQLMKSVYNEVIQVLESIQSDIGFHAVEQVCKSTSSNRSSMLQDLEQGRNTEADAILGYVLNEAEKKKLPVPVIRFLFLAIKGKSA